MYACEHCGEEFETLSGLRVRHEPCPVGERERRREEAIERLKEEWNLEVGDWCRVLGTGEEAEIVDVEPAEEDEDEPTVVWIPAGEPDTPDLRRRSPAGRVV
ncbi:hypothetical protein ACFQE8_23515 [Salinirubellus sp. GCM10025818]|uniref:hypothetical protein n=1 Tax=Salinirubellus TaxID=2162630 RepID=UPI0030CCB00A